MKKESEVEKTNFLLYQSPNGDVKVDVLLENENIWLQQKKIAELFWVDRSVITKHLKNIFESKELEEKWTSAIFALVQKEGNREISREVTLYNLDAILSVWYRVNSSQATQFRIWANKILKEFIIKGFTMDDERLKNPKNPFWKDYFDEQLERIRDIRSSERRLYQKITDIYSLCSIDYNIDSEITKKFFATVQNKIHYSVSWKTAAEIIYHRVDSKKDNMWLTNWKNYPNNTIRKSDIKIAKNYLSLEELDELNRIITMYLDFAELRAVKQIPMTMKDWIIKLDWFLQFNEKEVLQNKWKISKEWAIEKANDEFEIYNKNRLNNYESDFDIFVKESEVGYSKK